MPITTSGTWRRHALSLARPRPHPAGDLDAVCRNYRLADFLADARNQELVKSVHLQAAMADPVQETAWLQGLADAPGSGGFPHAIVAFADLADPAVEAVLERHCAHPNVRGIRFMLNHIEGEPLYCMTERGYWLREPGGGVATRSSRSTVCRSTSRSTAIRWPRPPRSPPPPRHPDHAQPHRPADRRDPDYLARLARRHAGARRAPERRRQDLGPRHVRAATGPPRASGRLVLDTIEIFGADRCMFASNFPVDRLHSDYDAIWRAFDQITADFSADERHALFHDNAARFYVL